MQLNEILPRFPDAKKSGKGWQCRCPAHDDKNPSLTISEGEDGKILLHCHARCTTDSILSKIGLTLADLFPDKPERNGHTNGNGSKMVAEYDYKDSDGKLIFQACRFEPKTFRQRRPDGKGGWIWDTKGVEKILFRLPEILREIARGMPIFICEGEKDVLAMVQHGFSATCNPGGAGKWQDNYSETLRGADVVVIADKDTPGRNHAQLVASKLHGFVTSIKVIELPQKDPADFYAAGGQAADLDEIAQAAPLWNPNEASKDSQVTIRALPEIMDAATFMEIPQEMPPELIAGVLHKGSKLALGGSSKAYKSWLLLDMAVSVAQGLPWLGFDTAQGKVLFVNFEIQPYAWQRRIAAVTNAKGVKLQPGQIALWNLRGHAADFSKLVPRIVERAKQQSFSFIVLDPIYKIYGGTDENSAGDVAALLNSIESLTVETGAAVAYGCHFAKGNASAKEAIDRISGSGVFARDPDSLLIFTKHDEPDAFTVDPILRNFAPVEPFVVRWNFPLFETATDLDPTKLKQAAGRKPSNEPEDLLKLLPATGLTNTDFLAAAKQDGISERSFYRLKKELERGGKIMLSKVTDKWIPISPKTKP